MNSNFNFYTLLLTLLLAVSLTAGTCDDSGDGGGGESDGDSDGDSDVDETTNCDENVPDCGTLISDFVACGGDVAGTWTLNTACMDWSYLDENPDCTEGIGGIAAGYASATVVFADGTVDYTDYQITQIGYSLTPDDCMAMGCEDYEGVYQDQWGDGCCEIVDGGACECYSWSDMTDMGDFSATYVLDANTITFDDGTPAEYCVDGNTLSILSDPGTDDAALSVMTLN